MSDSVPAVEESSSAKRFVPSLMLAVFGTGMIDVLGSLFLVDIAKAFFGSSSPASVGAASQILTFSSAAAVVSGLLTGGLSVRFKHKSLLLLGALCITIGAIGCFLAPSFLFMAIFYPFDGIGTIIVGSMAFSLVGELLPLERRAKAVGWIVAAAILAAAIGFPVAGFIAGIAGWRSYLLLYVLPISVVAFALALLSIPFLPHKQQNALKKEAYLSSFKQVLLNKSAAACLFGNMFLSAAGVWSFFAASFWRQQFGQTQLFVGVITFGITSVYAIGALVGGRLVNRVGRKRLAVLTWALRGLFIAAIVFMPDFWTAFTMSMIATLIGGIGLTSGSSLNLEQAPKSRGTMMSMVAMFGSLGSVLGAAAGGVALGQFGYQVLGVTFGAFGVVAASVIYVLAKDPCIR